MDTLTGIIISHQHPACEQPACSNARRRAKKRGEVFIEAEPYGLVEGQQSCDECYYEHLEDQKPL